MADRLASELTDGTVLKRRGTQVTQSDVAAVDFSELVARCMGNLAFAERILAKFEHAVEEDLVLLEQEVSQHDAAGVASIAHRLKGASANVAAHGLTEVFGRLEQLARSEQLGQVSPCMDELQTEWSRFKMQSPSLSTAES